MSDIHFEAINLRAPLSKNMALALYELDRRFFPTPWHLEAWEEIHNSDCLLIIATINKDIIGLCLFDKLPADSFAHLLKILVIPGYQNGKIGSNLLSTALELLKTAGIQQFFLEVEENNGAAQKLYLSHGFKIIHRKKHFYGNGQNALIMTQQLNE